MSFVRKSELLKDPIFLPPELAGCTIFLIFSLCHSLKNKNWTTEGRFAGCLTVLADAKSITTVLGLEPLRLIKMCFEGLLSSPWSNLLRSNRKHCSNKFRTSARVYFFEDLVFNFSTHFPIFIESMNSIAKRSFVTEIAFGPTPKKLADF